LLSWPSAHRAALRYRTIVKLSEAGAERLPAEFVAVMLSS